MDIAVNEAEFLDILKNKDQELWNLASERSIEFAGAILPYRVYPDREFGDSPPYWERLKVEFQDLLCSSSDKYQETREKIAKGANNTGFFIVTVVSGAIGDVLGMLPSVLVPFIAMLLALLAKVGKEAYCSGVDYSTTL